MKENLVYLFLVILSIALMIYFIYVVCQLASLIHVTPQIEYF
jgi:hypothetical protein